MYIIFTFIKMKLDETVEKNHHTRKFDKGLIGDVKIIFYKMINDKIINKFCKIYLIKFLLLLKLLLLFLVKLFQRFILVGRVLLYCFLHLRRKKVILRFSCLINLESLG